MPQYKTFNRGSAEWLEFRRSYITATEISILLGLNKYKTPRKLLTDKVNPSFTANVYTRMGKILEPAVANLTADVLETPVHSYAKEDVDIVFYNNELKLSATPDGYIVLPEGTYAVELKTTSRKNLEAWDKDVPLHYAVQLIQQMYLTDSVGGILTIMTPEYPTLPALLYRVDGKVPEHIVADLATLADRFFKVLNGEVKSLPRYTEIAANVTRYLVDNFEKIHSDVVRTDTEDVRPWWET